MAGGVQVLEEPDVRSPRPPRRRSYVPIATFVAGAVAGAVLFSPAIDPPSPETTEVSLPDPVTVAEAPVTPGIAEVVDGFEEALVAVVRHQDGIGYLVWAAARGPRVSAIPAGEGHTVTVDRSGTWIGILADAPDAEGGVLSLGRIPSIRPVVTGVDSFAWHDSINGLIGLLRYEDGSWGLYDATNFPLPTRQHDLGPGHPGTLVAFGSWGWALQNPGEFTVYGPPVGGGAAFREEILIAPPGGHVTMSGTLLDTHGSRFLYYDAGSVWLMEGGETWDLVALPNVVAGAISPGGTRAAILASNGIVVLDLESGARWSFPLVPAAPQLSWSGERFVVIPASPRGVRIVDLENKRLSAQLTGYTVYWAGTIAWLRP